MDTATKVAEDLAGLDAEPVVAVVVPSAPVDQEPEDDDAPVSEPEPGSWSRAAQTARVLVQALDQLMVSFEEVRRAAQALVEVLEEPSVEVEETPIGDEEEDEGEEGTDDGTEVPQGG